ncbi:MAG TPA: right-handed parallel beta-helix repeat-containing protein [Thermodesulfobacteriota bacterium]|nr:right-handed parallel beta-helix repeat-containing protein [Thermodesulfobacteriota bacterium]
MNRIVRTGVLIILISLGLVPLKTAGAGETHYVSTAGSDRNNGSLSTPWATIQHAATQSRPGDTILVRGGTYGEGEVWLRAEYRQGGAPGNLLTIKAYPNEVPVFVSGDRPVILECNYLRIEGLHFRNGKAIGVRGDTVQIVNNTFTGPGYAWAAVHAGGNNVLLEGNTCDISGNVMGTQGHCYYIHHSTNTIIRNNVAKGMTGYGIHVFDQRRSEDPPGFERLVKNVVIEGNTVSLSQDRSGIILDAYDHARIENVVMRNNVLFNNKQCGIYMSGLVSNVKIFNNTLFGNGASALFIGGSEREINTVEIKNNIFDLTHGDPKAYHVVNAKGNTSLILQNNLYWPKPLLLHKLSDPSPVIGDPRFANPAEQNFHLLPGSTAIDKGVPLNEVSQDKDGVKRPQGTASDLGAFEFH